MRELFTGPDDLVFANVTGGHLDGSALRSRFKVARDAAKLRPLRFHDLRHTFGSIAIRTADPREVQEWMGHSDFADATRRLGVAFAGEVANDADPLGSVRLL